MNAIDAFGLQLTIRPIGVVRSELKEPMAMATSDQDIDSQRLERMRREAWKTKTLVSELVVADEWREALVGLEEFSHVLVIYWAHLVPDNRRGIKQIRPMGRKDMPLRGVLATCSPARPNPILVSIARLLERDGTRLRVQGLEAVDGSPVLDVKPFVAGYHSAEDSTIPDWLKRIREEFERPPKE